MPNELDASVEQYNCLLYQCNLSDIEAALTHTCFKIRSFITFIELYIGEIVFMKEVDQLMTVEPDIIALDATVSLRPGGETLAHFYHAIRKKYPSQKLMADCSTMEEAIYADKLGFDFIGTTLVGYTSQSKGLHIENNDFELIRNLISTLQHPIIAEGNIDTPQKARRVLELGCYSVVVGSAITRPQLITKQFVNGIHDNF